MDPIVTMFAAFQIGSTALFHIINRVGDKRADLTVRDDALFIDSFILYGSYLVVRLILFIISRRALTLVTDVGINERVGPLRRVLLLPAELAFTHVAPGLVESLRI